MIRGVTFDWWHTVAETPWPDYDARMREIRIARVHDVLVASGVEASTEALSGAYDHHTDLLRRTWERHVDLTAEEQVEAFLELVGVDRRTEGLRASLADAFGGAIRVKVPILYPHVSAVLWRLRGAGFRIGLVSNTGRTWGRVLRGIQDDLGIGTAFHVRVFSDEVRVRKPDPRIFEIAADALGLAPREIVHVGDDLTADVAGAEASGMQAVWFNGADAPIEEIQGVRPAIRDHSELPGLLAGWRT